MSYKNCEEVGLRNFKDPKTFIEDSNDTKDVYNSIEEYNPGKKQKVLITFDDIIADKISNKKFSLVVTEFFIRTHQLNIFWYILQSHTFLYKRI